MKRSNNPKNLVIPQIVLGIIPLFLSLTLFAQPANNAPSGAVLLTSGTSCSTISGTLNNGTAATGTTGISTFCTATATSGDVWYYFVAQSTFPTVSISNLGAGSGNSLDGNAGVQIFKTNSTNPAIISTITVATLNANSAGCNNGAPPPATLSVTPGAALTVGNIYLVRVFTTLAINTSASRWGFNICVTDPPPPPANDNCASAINISSRPTCVTTNGTLVSATNVSLASCNGTSSDVWYTFTAQTTTPTITVAGTVGTNGRFQVLSGTCGGTLTSMFCSTSSSQTTSALSIGTSYFLRVYSAGALAAFTLCIDDPAPGNDASSSPTTLTPGTTCTNTSGTLYAGTFSSGTPTITGNCVSGTVTSDVWYTFIAPADNVNIALSGAGSSVTGVQLLSGTSGSMYSMACGGATGIPVASVVAGSSYYIRVYTNGTAPTTNASAVFNICVTATALSNDDCSGAINLNVNTNCSKVFGTVSLATASTGVPTSCGTTTSFDVWYKFTATSTNPVITLNDFGPDFTSSSGTPRRVEIYKGTCGSLTSVHCTSSNSGTFTISAAATSLPALVIGTTYYIRIYKQSGTVIGDGTFSICVTGGTTANVRVGNSYVNITKNTTGGVVQPNDILEIRYTVWVSNGAGATLYNTRFVDNIPSKTSMQTANEIQVITNEGLRYRGYTATDGVNDDAATYKSAPGAGEFNVRLNLGTTGTLPTAPTNNTSTSLGGANNLLSTANPQAGGGLMFSASYRVKVSGIVGDTIQLNGGRFLYRTATSSTADSIFTGTSYKILISSPLTLCTNSVGINNASEFGGTFGSGNLLNRGADLTFPIAGYSFVSASTVQAINDGQYAIVNNTSPRGGINQSANKKNICPTNVAPDLLCDNRMFGGYWYLNGDHSGTSNAIGNNPVAPGTTGGYMLAVNADYVASEAYRQVLTGLCPNTYYEFSAWVKNICATCGADSTGAQFAGTVTAPNAGYPGVLPNLTFAMDGLDRYSTGQMDAVAENGGWLKKGFVFLTGSSQTTATLTIRNNAQGGGGNDWVLDDISIATCFPSMSYSPTATPSVCAGNTIQIGDTVRSQFSNYQYYVWQRSQNGGSTWTDLTTPQTATPGLVGSQYQYITTLNVPAAFTTPADSGDIYRVYTATTVPNIVNPNCVANDGSAPISLSVLNCGIALKTDLLSFGGRLANGYGILSWTTSKEDGKFHFELESSDDNITYTRIYSVDSKNDGNTTNYYSFTDPHLITTKKWYRVALVNDRNARKFSNLIQLSTNASDFEIDNLINPFKENLSFNITIRKTEKINVDLIDMQGKIVKSSSYLVYAGTNNLQLNTAYLATGIYTLRINNSERVITKKVIKNN